MASILLKLVFLFSLIPSLLAAPLRLRSRAPAPAIEPVALHLPAQRDSFDFDLASTLISPISTLQTLETIPASCAAFSAECSSGSGYWEAVNVTYDDCGDAWSMCRCSTANMTMDTAVERLGRVPVGLRRYVATVLVAPDAVTHAYTLTSGDVHMFGDPQVNTWVHEAAHAYDWASGTPLSGSVEWAEAIGNDTCVPDTYSTTSVGEDFAQMTVMKILSMVHRDSLPTGWSLDCMSHQMQYMSSLPLFNTADLFGNTCAIVPSDPFSRHATAPSVTSTHVHPTYPAESHILNLLPVANVAHDRISKEDNAGLSVFYRDSKIAALFGVGSVVAWLLS